MESIQGRSLYSLAFLETSGFADYVVRLSFEGTRVLILSNLDNAEHPDLYFSGWMMTFIKLIAKKLITPK